MKEVTNCIYKTPCEWCSNWNKKCEFESDHEWECIGMSTAGSHYRCKKCGVYKVYPYKNNPPYTIT